MTTAIVTIACTIIIALILIPGFRALHAASTGPCFLNLCCGSFEVTMYHAEHYLKAFQENSESYQLSMDACLNFGCVLAPQSSSPSSSPSTSASPRHKLRPESSSPSRFARIHQLHTLSPSSLQPAMPGRPAIPSSKGSKHEVKNPTSKLPRGVDARVPRPKGAGTSCLCVCHSWIPYPAA